MTVGFQWIHPAGDGAHESVGKSKPINYRNIHKNIYHIQSLSKSKRLKFKLMIPVGKIYHKP